MQRVSVLNLADIHKLVFLISCLQKLIIHRQTDRQNRVHNQPPLYGWRLGKYVRSDELMLIRAHQSLSAGEMN